MDALALELLGSLDTLVGRGDLPLASTQSGKAKIVTLIKMRSRETPSSS